MSLGCAIITYNEEKNIERALESVSFCDEIVVVDSGSTDGTLQIARRYTDKIYYNKWPGFGRQKNFAIGKLTTDWVLNIDADEVVSDELKNEMLSELKNPKAEAYAVNIQLVFMGKPLRFGGTYPDYHIRLFKKGHFYFREDSVHEGVDAKAKKLKNPIYHYSYENLEEYFSKFNRYTTLIAQKHYSEGKRVGKLFPFVRFGFELFKRFVLKAAFLDGYPGILYAMLSSFYTFVKYAKLVELEK